MHLTKNEISISFSGLEMAQGTGKVRVLEAGGTDAHTNQIDRFAAQIRAIIGTVAPHLTAVHKDDRLSDSGKRQATKERLVKVWNQVEEAAGSLLRELDAVTAQKQAQVVIKPYTTGNALLDHQQALEVRDLIRNSGKEQSAIRAKYLALCESGDDPAFLHAVETAPKSFPILTPADIEKGKAIRAKSEHAGEVKEIEVLSALRAGYEYICYHAKSILKNIGLDEALFDWGRLSYEQSTGTVKPLTLRPYRNPTISKKNKTTPQKARAAGINVSDPTWAEEYAA